MYMYQSYHLTSALISFFPFMTERRSRQCSRSIFSLPRSMSVSKVMFSGGSPGELGSEISIASGLSGELHDVTEVNDA